MTFASLSFSSAAAAYGILIILLLSGHGRVRQGQWLVVAVAAASVWGLVLAVSAVLANGGPPSAVAYSVDALRALVWTLCLLAAFPGDEGWRSAKSLISLAATALAGLTLVSVWVLQREAATYATLLGAAVVGCLALEQIFRNSSTVDRRVLRSFLWAVGAIFVFDILVYSDALLFDSVDSDLWMMRGLLATLAVPVFVLAAKRHPDWAKTLFVSRKIVFYSTTFTGVGLYLVGIAIAGVFIHERGGEWGAFARLGFFVVAMAVLAAALTSTNLRRSVKMFISKNFYRHQYEYRDEWLRLIRTLSLPDSELRLDQRCVKALAAIIDSPGGQMWLDRSSRSVFEPFAAWQAPFPSLEFSRDGSPLVRFLEEHHWIIDSAEYEEDPEVYSDAFRDHRIELPRDSIVVPLFHQNELLGIVRLVRPKTLRPLNYEDHDLLKTVGRQVAAFLAHDLAREQLAETRQFEAYNKLAAFVMHDLKNLLAQQALLVENAKKHQHRPEFVADVIKTVDYAVQRMRRLLQHLERDSSGSHRERVELNALVQETVAAFAKSGCLTPSFSGHRPLWVHAQSDRLASVVGHVIANAQEATKPGDAIDVSVSVSERDGRALIEIRDNGLGMSEEFIRRRLFKPFDTTKGNAGMGIGVYQAREVVRALGGEIAVKSDLGIGTTISIFLPIAGSAAESRPSSSVG